MADVNAWKARLDHNALWVSLGVIALAVAVVAVGVQLAPETFYDQFVWEDIYGPLTVDAHQCRSSTDPRCADLGPPDVRAKDGYTVTSELVYGATLAVMLYGIYVGLFRRFGIVADGHFVLGLMPWILLGPLARTLEDADVFCAPGTHCDPNVFAHFFISPVIYIHIAIYVIAFMLLGVFLERRRHADPRLLTGTVAAVLGAGVAGFGLVAVEYGDRFSALPPVWYVALTALAGAALFHYRARQGKASMNLTVFVLGLPYALGSIYLIGDWLAGNVWSQAAWNGENHWDAALTAFFIATAVALAVRFGARALGGSRVERAWGETAQRAPRDLARVLAYVGLVALALVVASTGFVVRRLDNLGVVGDVLMRLSVTPGFLPLMATVGLLALAGAAFLHLGREAAARPGALLVFGAGMNVALVFAHMIDGAATWIAIDDPFGFGLPSYGEKHPFSDFLLQFWNGFLFPVAKLVMVLVIAWVLDREFREDSPDERNLVGLIKMAIFVLGFAPGSRNLLRVLMGV